MQHKSLGIDGGTVFWTVKDSHKETIQDGLRALGMSNYCPKDRSIAACLRAAMSESFTSTDKDKRFVVRPIKDGAVVASERHKDDVHEGDKWADVIAKAVIEDETRIVLHPYDWDKQHEIRQRVEESQKTYSAAAVSASLVKIADHFSGLCLRPNGGLYWLNKDELECFREVAAVFERAGQNEITVARVVPDESIARAVTTAIVDEVAQTVATLGDNLDNITIDGAERLLETANYQLQKVKRYENALSIPLDELKAKLNELGGKIALATIVTVGA